MGNWADWRSNLEPRRGPRSPPGGELTPDRCRRRCPQRLRRRSASANRWSRVAVERVVRPLILRRECVVTGRYHHLNPVCPGRDADEAVVAVHHRRSRCDENVVRVEQIHNGQNAGEHFAGVLHAVVIKIAEDGAGDCPVPPPPPPPPEPRVTECPYRTNRRGRSRDWSAANRTPGVRTSCSPVIRSCATCRGRSIDSTIARRDRASGRSNTFASIPRRTAVCRARPSICWWPGM